MPARHRPFTLKRGLLAILLAFPAQQALAANCTWNPATDCVTGMISSRLMLRCGGRVAT